MALPIPSSPVVVRDITDFVEEGTGYVHPDKSTYSRFTPFFKLNQCDAQTSVKLSTNLNVTQEVNCKDIQQASGTVTLYLPPDAVAADITAMLDMMELILADQLALINP